MTGEALGYFMEIAMEQSYIKDVFYQAILMKKNRPAVQISLICEPTAKDQALNLVMKHTTTFGIRWQNQDRFILDRHLIQRDTENGPITYKVGFLDGQSVKMKWEYEDIKQMAKKTGKSLAELNASLQEQVRDWGINTKGGNDV